MFPKPEEIAQTFEETRIKLKKWADQGTFPNRYLEDFTRFDTENQETDEFKNLMKDVIDYKYFQDLRNQLHKWSWRRAKVTPAVILFGNMEEIYDNFVGPRHLTPWNPEKWEATRSIAVWANVRKLYKQEASGDIPTTKISYTEQELRDLFLDIMEAVATREAGHFIPRLPMESVKKKTKRERWQPVKKMVITE